MAREYVIGGAQGKTQDVDSAYVLTDADEAQYKLKANSTSDDLELTKNGTKLASWGNGGAVTQETSASTGVTLSKLRGQITTVALETAAAGEERFTVTNTKVEATDVIVLSTTYTGGGTPMLQAIDVTDGTFDIVITNVHGSAAFNAAMVINFVVLKGAIS